MSANRLPAHYWADMTTMDFQHADIGRWLAVLPIAAVEQHGPHLPLSTDSDIAAGMIETVIPIMPPSLLASFLPIQMIGKSDEHLNFAGTLSLGFRAAIDSWIDIGMSVQRTGIKRLVIISSHGGNNNAMQVAAEHLRHHEGLETITTSWSRFGVPENLVQDEELHLGIHGGEVETALMSHFKPASLRMDKIGNFASTQSDLIKKARHLRHYGAHQRAWAAQELNPSGVTGNAAAATAETGKKIAQYRAKGFVQLLHDIADHL